MTAQSKNSQLWEYVETNLVRYIPNGKYYVKAKLRGRKVKESLDTTNLTEARRKLAAWMNKVRGGSVKGKSATVMASLIEDYKIWLSNKLQAPRTTEYRLECLEDIRKTWKNFDLAKVGSITRLDVETWRDSLVTKHGYSNSRANGDLGTLRQMFTLAESKGLLLHDPPTLRIKYLRVSPKKMHLPSLDQFQELQKMVYSRSKPGGQLFDFLSRSGCRIESACNARWSDVDWEANTLHFRKAKRGSYTIPLFPALREFLESIKPENPKPNDRITKVNSIKKVLGSACAALKLSHLSHHDLRHWFATRVIERGVDIPTLSRWLGHKDGGALAMKVYGHLRDEHSQKMAQRMT